MKLENMLVICGSALLVITLFIMKINKLNCKYLEIEIFKWIKLVMKK
jgi:hypothetical protein